MEFKSITLSAHEIDRLLSIDDADERREVREFMSQSMANPESVHAEEYRDSSPTIYKMARRIERRVKSARRRAERKSAPKPVQPAPANPRPEATERESTVTCVVLASNERIFKSTLTSLNDHLDRMLSRFNIFETPSRDNAAFTYLTDLRDRINTLLTRYVARPRPDIHPQAASLTFPTTL